jgi:SAM-dependent methyltransferase
MEKIADREKEFHNLRFVVNAGKREEDKFYRALYSMTTDFYDYIYSNSNGRDVLDYGCGDGERAIALQIQDIARSITAIDISDEAIKLAKLGSLKSSGSSSGINFLVKDCELTGFHEESFHLIYGNGIIHHLDTRKSIQEVHRLLKKEGSIIFYEPLGTNPVINLYRYLTPKSRTRDEHPLIMGDFEVIRSYFPNLKLYYYGLFTLLFLPLYSNPDRSKIFKLAQSLDKFLFKNIRLAKYFAWSVLLVAKK